MSDKPNEFISPELQEPEIREMLVALPSVLMDVIGNEIVEASYGWASNLHIDLCWIPMQVNVSWLDRFIDDSIRQEITIPGRSDFTFTVRGGALEIEFCHEGHLHISGTDPVLIGKLISHPQYSKIGALMSPHMAPNNSFNPKPLHGSS